METHIGKKLFHVYAFDVESHNDPETISKGETSIWLACLIDDKSQISDEKTFMYTMEEVVTRLSELSHPSNRRDHSHNLLIYVYNLAFEYSFLLPVLYRLGWSWGIDRKNPKDHSFEAVTTKTCSSVWEITLHFDKTAGEVIFRDMAKIYGGGLRNVAKSFGLETQKGEIDYYKNRLHDYVVTDEEKVYCYNDTHILVEILEKIIERKDKRFFNSLSAGTYAASNMIRETKNSSPYKYFRKSYPEITGDEAEFLRHTIAGGITYATPLFQFKDIKDEVCHVDANQMHPSSAYLNHFPYGRGTYGKGEPREDTSKIRALHVRVSYYGVKLHSVIRLIGWDFIDDYELWLWDFELELMKECYEELEIEFIDYYEYKTKPLPWRDFYAENWSKRMKAIEDGDAFGKVYYKLLNNSSYGKLIEKPHIITFQNIINADGVIDSIETKREVNKSDNGFYNAKYTYIPVGSCIPAYSRKCLIEKALDLGWENVVYFDTDSIFFLWNKETEKRLNRSTNFDRILGGWKLEEVLTHSQFTAPKRYKAETTDHEVYVKAAGFNFNDLQEMDFDTVDIISSTWDVHRSYRVKGGTIVDYQKKEFSIPKKYIDIYNQNTKI